MTETESSYPRTLQRTSRLVRTVVLLLGLGGVAGLAAAPRVFGPPWELISFLFLGAYVVPLALYWALARTVNGSLLIGLVLLGFIAASLKEGHAPEDPSAAFFFILMYLGGIYLVAVLGSLVDLVVATRNRNATPLTGPGAADDDD